MLIKKSRSKGFTMIELLMVIMLVAILGAVALPQFLDFRQEGKVAAARQLESSFNVGLKMQLTQSRLRCGVTDQSYPPLDSLAANDITAGSTPVCTTAQITNPAERRFIDSAELPANPFNNLRTVGDCVSDSYVGWCYSQLAGSVVASSQTSSGASAGPLTLTCSVTTVGPSAWELTVSGNCVDGEGDVNVGSLTPAPCAGGTYAGEPFPFYGMDPHGESWTVAQGDLSAAGICN